VPRVDGRPLPIDRRGAVCAPRLPLPRCAAGPQQVAATHQVASCPPSLHCPVLPGHRSDRGGDRRVVRDSHHWPLSEGPLRLRGGRIAMEHARDRLCDCARHGPLSSVPAERLTPGLVPVTAGGSRLVLLTPGHGEAVREIPRTGPEPPPRPGTPESLPVDLPSDRAPDLALCGSGASRPEPEVGGLHQLAIAAVSG